MPFATYGLELDTTGDELADRLAVECYAFRMGLTEADGALGKFQHFKNIVDLLWNNPELECQKRFIWNSWAEKEIREACEYDYLAVSGSASSGKSDPFALWGLVNYIADPTHCKVLV